LCDSEYNLGNFDEAIPYCRRSLNYDPDSAYGHYLLGQIYAEQASLQLDSGDVEGAARVGAAALQMFGKMLEINPYLDPEAEYARRTSDSLEAFLASR
jgi:tetratricopeptide (TPR) repeat protein